MEQELATATRAHHPYSPSSLQYRESCAYWDSIQGSDNAASRAGSLQHDATDRGEDDERLSDQQAAAVAECLRYTDSVAAKYPGGTIIKEQYLPIDSLVYVWLSWQGVQKVMNATTAGYLDWAIVSADKKRAEIVDYKFGQWGVEPAENNTQGMSYLLGLFVLYPDLDEVTVTFFLPHRDEISSHTFKRAEFKALYLRIKTIVSRALEARADYTVNKNSFEKATPNTGACVFCANIGRCDAVAKFALNIGNKFSPVQVPETITPSLLRDAKDTGAGLKVAAVIRAWADAYRAQASAKALAEDGFVPEGYILVSSQDREIVDNKKFRDVAREYLTDDEIDLATSIAITPVEDLIKSKAARGTKEATREEFDTKLREAGAVVLGVEKAYLKLDKKAPK